MTDSERRERHRAACKAYRQRHQQQCKAYAKAYRQAHKTPPAPMPARKVCTNCLIEKDRSEFTKRARITGERPTRGALGVERICKACRSHLRKPTLIQERQQRAELATANLKTCNVCKRIKPYGDFAQRRASTDGLSHTCRVCANSRSLAWKLVHPSHHADWYQKNKAHKSQYWAQWREANREHCRAEYRRWAALNHDRVIANTRHRELTKVQATPPWASKESMRPFYAEAARLTQITGIQHEVDHIVPLRSPVVCGLHVASNLQILTREANKKKSNHHATQSPAASALR